MFLFAIVIFIDCIRMLFIAVSLYNIMLILNFVLSYSFDFNCNITNQPDLRDWVYKSVIRITDKLNAG